MQRSLRVKPDLVKAVKLAIVRQGFASQAEIAQKLDLSRTTVSSFTNGRPVSRENFVEISNLLGLDWTELSDLPVTPTQDTPANAEDAFEAVENSGILEDLVEKKNDISTKSEAKKSLLNKILDQFLFFFQDANRAQSKEFSNLTFRSVEDRRKLRNYNYFITHVRSTDKDPLSEVVGEALGRQISEVLFQYAYQYTETYRKRYGYIKILGMRESKSVESLYTEIRCLDDISIRRFESVRELEKKYFENQKRSLQNRVSSQLKGVDYANKYQYLMVLGAPGAGKSTFLKSLTLEVLKGKRGQYNYSCIPVFIELKRFQWDESNFEKIISDELNSFNVTLPRELIISGLEQGRFLVVLDGLDEVPSKKLDLVVSYIHDFVSQYSRNRFVASCRLASYRSSLTHFTDVEIANFDDSQIRLFINNWFSSDLDERVGLADLLWEELNKPQNILAKELAQTPLLLTFLCMVYDRSKNLPGNRSVLYQKSLDILLEEWAAEKRIQLGDIYDGISTELEKLLLSEIAYKGFQQNQFFFREQDLVDQIALFLEETLAPNDVDSRKVLSAIVEKQGVFVERAEGIFSFSHLTIQEYLTALYISQDYRRVKDAVSKYSIQKEWKDIFLLTAGLLHTADELIELIEKESRRYIKTEKLQKRLKLFSEEAEKLNLSLCPAAKRAAVLFIAISCRIQNQSFPNSKSLTACRNHALFLFNALSANSSISQNRVSRSKSLSLLIADSMDKSIYSDIRKAPEALNAVVEELDLRRSNLLSSLKEEKVLSRDDIKLLRTYLYMNELAVKCKEAATRISRDKWEEIERLLLLIAESD